MSLETETIQAFFAIAESYKVGDKGRFTIKAQLQTDKLLPKNLLKKYYKTVINKEVRLDHAIPEIEPEAFIGVVKDAWWENSVDAPFVELDIYGDTATERLVRKWLKEDKGKPVSERHFKGISAGIVQRYAKRDGKRELVQLHFREVSVVFDPACEECYVRYHKQQGAKINMPLSKEEIEAIVAPYSAQMASQKASFESIIKLKDQEIETYKNAQSDLKTKLDDAATKVEKLEADSEKYKKERDDLQDKLDKKDKMPHIEKILIYNRVRKDSEAWKKGVEELMQVEAPQLAIQAKYANPDPTQSTTPLFGNTNNLLPGNSTEQKVDAYGNPVAPGSSGVKNTMGL